VPGSWDRPSQSRAPEQPDAHKTLEQLSRESPRNADWAEPADHLATDDHPARWSRADLQQRLERLPPGHPSSPDDDGFIEDIRDATADHQTDSIERGYWSEVPGFLRASADHTRRWPAEHVEAQIDRSEDEVGSWRGDGGQYLHPELNRQAEEQIAAVRLAEERITDGVGEIGRHNTHGGWLEGIEHCRKGDDRLKEKIADAILAAPVKTPKDVIHDIPDAIRYTFCFGSQHYTDGYFDVKQRLQEQGHRLVYSKNHWGDDRGYKGTNTRWETAEGQRFEIQFHNAESHHAKQNVTHGAYERIRNRLTSRAERRELEAFQRDVCSLITSPDRVADIPDYEERD
jgi:hypothetical protein